MNSTDAAVVCGLWCYTSVIFLCLLPSNNTNGDGQMAAYKWSQKSILQLALLVGGHLKLAHIQ